MAASTNPSPSSDWVSLPEGPVSEFFVQHGLEAIAEELIELTGAESVSDLALLDAGDVARALNLKMVANIKLANALASLKASAQVIQDGESPAQNPSPIEEAVAICIDRSASMRTQLGADRSRMEAVKQMFYAFRDRVDSLGGGTHKLGLLQFDNQVETLLQPTSKLDLFEARVDEMCERGQTAIYSAILESAKMLEQVGTEHPQAYLRILALTDGQNNAGVDWKVAANAALALGCVVDAIIVGDRPDENLRRIVLATGGECFIINTLAAGFELLEAETVASLRARRGGAEKPPSVPRSLPEDEKVPMATLTASHCVKRTQEPGTTAHVKCVRAEAFFNTAPGVPAGLVVGTNSEEELVAAFKALGPHGTGRVSSDDLQRVMTTCGQQVSDAELQALMKNADTDGAGEVSYQQLIKLMLEGSAQVANARAPAPSALARALRGRHGAVGKRLMKELHDVAVGSGVHIFPSEENLLDWRALIEGPVGSPFQGGTWLLTVGFPDDYPFKAPRIRFVTPIFHCNVSDGGSICIDVLHSNWSPALSVPKVLEAIRCMLADPNTDDSMRQWIAELTLAHRQHGGADTRYVDGVRENIKKDASKTVAEWCEEWGCA